MVSPLDVGLVVLAAFLFNWACIITYNRPFVEDKFARILSYVFAVLIVAMALGLVLIVA